MKEKKLKILLVMHTIPVNSGFLAAKFIHLSDIFDLHLLAWDTKNNIDRFIEQHKLPASFRQKIHLGNINRSNFFSFIWCLLVCFLTVKKCRSYLFSGEGNFIKRIKNVVTYLPAIRLHADIIHFEFGTLAQKGIVIKQFTDAILSVSFRGYDLNYAGLEDKEYYSEVWRICKGFHFLGNDLMQRAIQRGYGTNGIAALIPPGVDISVFKPDNSSKEYQELKIISVGRLVWKKGYEYSIRAALILKQKGIPFQYKIIGQGNHLQALQFIIKESGLENEIILTGELPPTDVRKELAAAHVFVHPAISEGFSNAVLEAQAMGLPVVCTDADGLTENIEDNVTGLIVPKWDAEAIADKLQVLWNDKDMMIVMGQSGTERVAKHFTIEKQMADFSSFYNELYSAS